MDLSWLVGVYPINANPLMATLLTGFSQPFDQERVYHTVLRRRWTPNELSNSSLEQFRCHLETVNVS